MSKKAVSVSRLVSYMNRLIQNDMNLQQLDVEGEISNYSDYRSGHWYFKLKDENAQIQCVMFSSANSKVDFTPKDGDKVIITGDLNIFEGRGELQIIVSAMKPAGVGDLHLQYEQLKKRLEETGYFEESHKKPIPKYPFQIALITGKDTAARSDVLTTLKQRWPIAKIEEYPVLVQGNESAKQIIQALLTADQKEYDVILLVRGGGSIEDLWSFNDEALAKTIYHCQTPIITGVGHETDFTIADFVSDLRAPTPTGAAVLASPKLEDVLQLLQQSQSSMKQSMQSTVETYQTQIDNLKNRRIFKQPETLYREKQLKVNSLESNLEDYLNTTSLKLQHELDLSKQSMNHSVINNIAKQTSILNQFKNRFYYPTSQSLQTYHHTILQYQLQMRHEMEKRLNDAKTVYLHHIQLLDAFSPLKVLERGYSITKKENQILKSIANVKNGDHITTTFQDGMVISEVIEIEKEN